MRNDDVRIAKRLNWLIYLCMTIIVVIESFQWKERNDERLLVVLLFCVVSVVLHRIISVSRRVSVSVHAIVTAWLMLSVGYFAGIISGKTSTFQIFAFVPIFSFMIYLDSQVFKKTGTIIVAVYLLAWIFKFPYIVEKPLPIESILCFFILVLANLVVVYFTRMIAFQIRQSDEMEQSLDDLLKVVWAKCSEAKAATKSKSAFLSSMSHEIRTPINAVMGMNELILQNTESEEIIEYANNIESSGNILLGLINDILDFSKIESGKMDIVEVEYQVSSMLNDLINMIQPKAEAKELEFKVEVSCDIPNALLGDDLRVKQVVTNLLSNAVKYTEEGEVRLSATSEQLDADTVNLIFEVEDTGIGMKPEDLEKLFDSFSRFDNLKNRSIQGTGLGMAIVKQIIDLCNGDIQVESMYGEGTKYRVIIPQKIADATPMGDFQENYKKSRPNVKKRSHFVIPDAKILVVDDNTMNLKVAKGLLKTTQAQVTMAMSGRECINKVEKDQYDLILLDHMMPEMDGIETLEEMKKRGLAKETPIIALTANAISGAKEMYLSHGFEDYLTKPIAGEVLYRAILKWLPDTLIQEVPDAEEEPTEAARSEMKRTEPPVRKESSNDQSENGKTETESKPVEENRSMEKVSADAEQSAGDFVARYINMETALAYSIDELNGVLFNLESFVNRIGGIQLALQEQISAANYEEAKETAQAVISMAMTVGLDGVCKEAGALRDACGAGDGSSVLAQHKKLTSYLEELVAAFLQYQAS